MEKSNIVIRLEKKEEYQKVENLVRESFWNVYRPGCLEQIGRFGCFLACSSVISNKKIDKLPFGYYNISNQTVIYEENEGKNSKGKSNIYYGI